MKHVPPSVRETAFNCPHCGALTTQHWHIVRAAKLEGKRRLPLVLDAERRQQLNLDEIDDDDERARVLAWADLLVAEAPFLWEDKEHAFYAFDLCNVSVSQCFNCKALSLWIYDRLVYPRVGDAPPANPDLSPDIRRDYDEAGSILDQSPRGAAALLRLAIQKLCIELGYPGKNLNDDIAALVEAGLDPQVQQALDSVRVIGNHAVHPGQIGLRDDRATAELLFGLLNLIVEKLVTLPKRVAEVYGKLPDRDRQAIARRDGAK